MATFCRRETIKSKESLELTSYTSITPCTHHTPVSHPAHIAHQYHTLHTSHTSITPSHVPHVPHTSITPSHTPHTSIPPWNITTLSMHLFPSRLTLVTSYIRSQMWMTLYKHWSGELHAKHRKQQLMFCVSFNCKNTQFEIKRPVHSKTRYTKLIISVMSARVVDCTQDITRECVFM